MERKIKYGLAVLFGAAVGCIYGGWCFHQYKKKDMEVAIAEMNAIRKLESGSEVPLYEFMGKPVKGVIESWIKGIQPPTRRQMLLTRFKYKMRRFLKIE